MALNDFAVVRPNSKNGGVDPLELAIEEFTGVVEGTIARKSVLKGMIPIKPVKGTATLSNYAVGQSTLQRLGNDGATLDGTSNDFSKITVTVDTTVAARATLPLLDVFQTNFDARKEIGVEHGKKIAKFYDQSFFIQAIKAAQLASSPYGSDGHYGGSTKTLSASGDKSDPAKLYSAIADLFTTMEGKDVEPGTDDIILAFKPEQFYTLLQAEQIVNGEYVTAEGTSIKGMIFKAFGCPAIRSNNLPAETTISSHLLSNASNSNAYDGDFTKVLAVAFSPRALLAGETLPLQTKVFFDDVSKLWFVDAWLSYAVTPNRPEYAGAILLP